MTFVWRFYSSCRWICLMLALICYKAFSLTFFSSKCLRRSFVWSCCDLYLSIFLLRILICSFTISYLFTNFDNFSSVYWVFVLYWFDIVDSFYKIRLDSSFPLVEAIATDFCSFYFNFDSNYSILFTNIWIYDCY